MGRKSLIFLISALLAGTVAAGQANNELLKTYQSYIGRLDEWEQKRGVDENYYDSLQAINRSLKHFLITHRELFNLNFSDLDGKGSIILTSEDKKVRIYCWDNGQGGTMRFPNSVIHFQGHKGVVSDILCEDSTNEVLCSFYLELHCVPTSVDTFYILGSHTIGSSGYGLFEIEAFKLENDTLNWGVKAFETKNELLSSISYEYDVTSGGPNPTADHPYPQIDWSKKTIRIPLIDKKNRITGKNLVYSYNGMRFKYQGVK